MTASEYRSIRQSIGSQAEVAKLLGVAKSTVARRETSALPITMEAALSIRRLIRPYSEVKKTQETFTIDGVPYTGDVVIRQYPATRHGWSETEITLTTSGPIRLPEPKFKRAKK
jgi:hypothetical protein